MSSTATVSESVFGPAEQRATQPSPRWTSQDGLPELLGKRSELLLVIARHRVRIQRLAEASATAEAGLGSARLALSLLVNRARTAGFLLDEDEVMERAGLIEEQVREQSAFLVSAREDMERSWVREQELVQDLRSLDDRVAQLRAVASAEAFQAAWDAVELSPDLSDAFVAENSGPVDLFTAHAQERPEDEEALVRVQDEAPR